MLKECQTVNIDLVKSARIPDTMYDEVVHSHSAGFIAVRIDKYLEYLDELKYVYPAAITVYFGDCSTEIIKKIVNNDIFCKLDCKYIFLFPLTLDISRTYLRSPVLKLIQSKREFRGVFSSAKVEHLIINGTAYLAQNIAEAKGFQVRLLHIVDPSYNLDMYYRVLAEVKSVVEDLDTAVFEME